MACQWGKKLVNQLADREFYLLLDALELGLVDDKGFRRQERVSVANTRNPFSKEVFNRFTQLAAVKAKIKQRTKPKILVVTASARDPFEAVDFYQSVFAETGAEVSWLPIDAALNTLWQQQGTEVAGCTQLEQYQAEVLGTIKRKFVYPDHYLNQQQWCREPAAFINAIEQADGLFINGGDQSLTLQAFKNKDGTDNALLKAVRKQLEQNQLIVGGTSAGTAVMSGGVYQQKQVPMITNGRSEVALLRGAKADVLPSAGCNKDNQCGELLNDDLTYNSQGGMGLFKWGIMDTHFSERGRQGRLVKLVTDTQSRFAFGVDEATALVVSWQSKEQLEMQVVGQTGVFVVENKLADGGKKNQVLTHFATRDDRMRLQADKLTIDFASWKQASSVSDEQVKATTSVTESVTLPVTLSRSAEVDDIFAGENYLKAAHNLCNSADKSLMFTSHFQGKQIELTLTKAEHWQQASGVIESDNTNKDYCSYQNMAFDYQLRYTN
ncbi:hypothetical protein EXU30_03770 [Shewanella maritima]|uniref:Cyanophycinase n=1 Tax=Shewanella maritima TaxID=2520507 RepID=A0A411PEF4_9GAMM|nr:cyanophycinase [Shewanella maritima]QBF81913.1 hypothetical protein EXU30_03770 [Shewanella maritima]